MATSPAVAGALFVLGLVLGAGTVYISVSSSSSASPSTVTSTLLSTVVGTTTSTATLFSTQFSTSFQTVTESTVTTATEVSTTSIISTTTVAGNFSYIQQPWPTIDQFGSECINGPAANFSQSITTTRPNALAIFIAVNHNNNMTNFTGAGLTWEGPLNLFANSTPQVYWANVPNPGIYTVKGFYASPDHFKLLWFDVTGAVTAGNPFDSSLQKSGPVSSDTMSARVTTTKPNDLVMAYFEQEPISAPYVVDSPFSIAAEALQTCYSQAEFITVAPFSSPTNQIFDILQSSTPEGANEWSGSTIGILSSSP